jgi:hypothetical protein
VDIIIFQRPFLFSLKHSTDGNFPLQPLTSRQFSATAELDLVSVPAHDTAAAIEDVAAAISPLNSMDWEAASRKGVHCSIPYIDSGRSSNDESAN